MAGSRDPVPGLAFDFPQGWLSEDAEACRAADDAAADSLTRDWLQDLEELEGIAEGSKQSSPEGQVCISVDAWTLASCSLLLVISRHRPYLHQPYDSRGLPPLSKQGTNKLPAPGGRESSGHVRARGRSRSR